MYYAFHSHWIRFVANIGLSEKTTGKILDFLTFAV